MKINRDPSCADAVEPELLPVEQALSQMLSQLPAVAESETLLLRDAHERVLAESVSSPLDVPSYTNSAMDGYAIHAADIPADGRIASLTVKGTSWAGRPFDGPVSRGEAVRIMTGGMMPAGTDTVVIQEHVEIADDQLRIDSDVEPGRNVRHAGEDVKKGDSVLQPGEWLGPAQIGLLASLGIDRVAVRRRIRVAFFSTGDELRQLDDGPDQQPRPGEIFDSNRFSLFGLLRRLNVELIDLGVVRDNPEDTRRAFLRAAERADVVLTSGGVSAGEADYVTRILHEIGEVSFWKLAMRPGRPLAFGKVNGSVFFGLPGNPVAVMITFYEFVAPALKTMMGCQRVMPLQIPVRCTSSLRKSPGRTEFQRGILGRDAAGELTVETTGRQGAGRLSSMAVADCIIVLSPDIDEIRPGDSVEVQPFYGLV